MHRLIAMFFSLGCLLLVSDEATAGQIYKCDVNGAVHYQQQPCQSAPSRKPPTVEELNAARKEQAAQAHNQVAPRKAPDRPSVASQPAVSSYRCDGRLHCSQMTSCAEAKYFLSNCPGVNMDGDGDGIPCEDQLCGH